MIKIFILLVRSIACTADIYLCYFFTDDHRCRIIVVHGQETVNYFGVLRAVFHQ